MGKTFNDKLLDRWLFWWLITEAFQKSEKLSMGQLQSLVPGLNTNWVKQFRNAGILMLNGKSKNATYSLQKVCRIPYDEACTKVPSQLKQDLILVSKVKMKSLEEMREGKPSTCKEGSKQEIPGYLIPKTEYDWKQRFQDQVNQKVSSLQEEVALCKAENAAMRSQLEKQTKVIKAFKELVIALNQL